MFRINLSPLLLNIDIYEYLINNYAYLLLFFLRFNDKITHIFDLKKINMLNRHISFIYVLLYVCIK